MAGFRSARMAEDLKREIGLFIRDLKDPRVKSDMISIVRVEVSSDCSFARVYVSSMGGMESAKLAVKGFESASGYIKRELSNRLHLRKCPEIKYIPDDSMEYSAHLDKLFEQTHSKEKNDEE